MFAVFFEPLEDEVEDGWAFLAVVEDLVLQCSALLFKCLGIRAFDGLGPDFLGRVFEFVEPIGGFGVLDPLAVAHKVGGGQGGDESGEEIQQFHVLVDAIAEQAQGDHPKDGLYGAGEFLAQVRIPAEVGSLADNDAELMRYFTNWSGVPALQAGCVFWGESVFLGFPLYVFTIGFFSRGGFVPVQGEYLGVEQFLYAGGLGAQCFDLWGQDDDFQHQYCNAQGGQRDAQFGFHHHGPDHAECDGDGKQELQSHIDFGPGVQVSLGGQLFDALRRCLSLEDAHR